MKKETRKFYFSVEGETEQWYLNWLQESINTSPGMKYNAKFDCKVEKEPLARVKNMNVLGRTEIAHIMDRESENPVHVQQFYTALDQMKESQNIVGKRIIYYLGYSNFTFELWMILHKIDCNSSLNYRHQYLSPLNKAYLESFANLDQYKQEDNFKRVLGKLSLAEVWHAIARAKRIMKRNEENGYGLQQYKGYTYCRENPSLSLWHIIEKILNECGLTQQRLP